MRWTTLALAGALNLIFSLSVAAQGPPSAAVATQPLTLVEAWRLAEAANPTLLAKQTQLAAAQGAQTEAAALLSENPELALETTRRTVSRPDLDAERLTEWKLGVSQAFEIAGQPAYRRTAADSALQALKAEIEDARRQVRVEVGQHFYRLLGLQDRLEIERQALALFDATAAAVEKRRAAGEDTRLDANFAVVEAERARNQIGILSEQLLAAQGDLAARLQLAPHRLPQAIGSAANGELPARYALDQLLAAVDGQPRIDALAAKEDSARARLSLERARRYPDVTLGLSVGREGASDSRERLATVSVSVPLPLFKRNEAAIGQATTDLAQAEIERQATLRNLRGDVQVLWARLQSLQGRVQRLRTRVVPVLEDNIQLSLKSRNAGQIGLLELIVVNRQSLDARRELIEAVTEYHTTRLALELAAGLSIEEAKR